MKLQFARWLLLLLLLPPTLCQDTEVKSLSRSSISGMKSALHKQLVKLEASKPAKTICPILPFPIITGCLVHSVQAKSHAFKSRFYKLNLDSIVMSYGLPFYVLEKIRAIVSNHSTEFLTFTIVEDRVERFEAYVGTARWVGKDDVEFSVVHGVAVGKLRVLKEQLVTIGKIECHRRFLMPWLDHCKGKIYKVPRNNTDYELDLVKQALRHRAVRLMKKKLNRALRPKPLPKTDTLRNCATSFVDLVLPYYELCDGVEVIKMMNQFAVTYADISVATVGVVSHFIHELMKLPRDVTDLLEMELFAKITSQPQNQWVTTNAMVTKAKGNQSTFAKAISFFTRLRSQLFDLTYAYAEFSSDMPPAEALKDQLGSVLLPDAAMVLKGNCKGIGRILMLQKPSAANRSSIVKTATCLKYFNHRFFLANKNSKI